MNRLDLEKRVRSITRDFNSSLFRKYDVNDYLNEAIDRCRQLIVELDGMVYLDTDKDVPILLPSAYHHLLAIYCASRLYHQDEQHYQAGNLMNEFETKLAKLHDRILSGELEIVDPDGNVVGVDAQPEYVVNTYFKMKVVDV